ncbi:hypothetical protein EDB84DRAFT_1446263 [Lactarius hengduanensis]|nr:hypothetical protein EDB84DRAFT_1446263 [Lactarius hengduanensis]
MGPLELRHWPRMVGASLSGEKGNPPNGSKAAEAATASNSANSRWLREGGATNTIECHRMAGAATVAKMVGACGYGEMDHPPNGPDAAEAAAPATSATPSCLREGLVAHTIGCCRTPGAATVTKMVGACGDGEMGHPPNGPDAAEAAAPATSATPSCLREGLVAHMIECCRTPRAATVAIMVGACGYGEMDHPPHGPDAAEAAAPATSATPSCLREGLVAHTIGCCRTPGAATVTKMVGACGDGEMGHPPNGPDAAEAAAPATSATPSCLREGLVSVWHGLRNPHGYRVRVSKQASALPRAGPFGAQIWRDDTTTPGPAQHGTVTP